MTSKIRVEDILGGRAAENGEVLVSGWVKTRRDAKGFSFLEINDGSRLANLQVVAELSETVKKLHTGAAVEVRGLTTASPGRGQQWEIKALELRLIGEADPETYPLQKKRHSDEFLREIAHLRGRTNKFGAVFRLRSRCAWAVHDFFRERGFFHVHTPIITGSDCEGAGRLFQVSAPSEGGPADFFGRAASLTVSGQLEAELMAMGLGRVYTFGPTFRAENSNTPRHAAEFWMIEPEMAFADLGDDMDLAEALVKNAIEKALADSREDLALFDRFVEPGLLGRLESLMAADYIRLPYAEAVRILESSGSKFEFAPAWGADLQTEHERHLCEVHFKKPVIVHDYPKELKPFYMRLNDDGRTVAAMDLLVPKVGELAGGSQREERLDVLSRRMADQGLDQAAYWWYLDTRRFGSAPHAGFGLGFERLLMLLTGLGNIRDVLPFPRTPQNLEF